MSAQAAAFGSAELSRAADIVNSALTEMTGATSPRLHLETDGGPPSGSHRRRGGARRAGARRATRAAHRDRRAPLVARASRRAAGRHPIRAQPARGSGPDPRPPPRRTCRRRRLPRPGGFSESPVAEGAAEVSGAAEAPGDSPAPAEAAAAPRASEPPAAPVELGQLRDAWPEILEVVKRGKRSAWLVLATSDPARVRGRRPHRCLPERERRRVVPAAASAGRQRQRATALRHPRGARSAGEVPHPPRARGRRPRAADAATAAAEPPRARPPLRSAPRPPRRAPLRRRATLAGTWSPSRAATSRCRSTTIRRVVSTTSRRSATPTRRRRTRPPAPHDEASVQTTTAAPTSATSSTSKPAPGGDEPRRYGEAVVRELLRANFLEEQSLRPATRRPRRRRAKPCTRASCRSSSTSSAGSPGLGRSRRNGSPSTSCRPSRSTRRGSHRSSRRCATR